MHAIVVASPAEPLCALRSLSRFSMGYGLTGLMAGGTDDGTRRTKQKQKRDGEDSLATLRIRYAGEREIRFKLYDQFWGRGLS